MANLLTTQGNAILSVMYKKIHIAHIWLGMFIAIPMFAWSFSGFIYTLPDKSQAGRYEVIATDAIKIDAKKAIKSAEEFAGGDAKVSSMTLQKKNGVVEYVAIAGVRSITVNAETGKAANTPESSWIMPFFRQAHFFFFAYPYNTLLTAFFSFLCCLSVASGVILNVMYWRG